MDSIHHYSALFVNRILRIIFLILFLANIPLLLNGCLNRSPKVSVVSEAQKAEFFLQNGHSSGVFSVAFSPDGKTLASASHDHTIKIWESETGKLIRTLKGHSDSVSSVAFSPDGKTLASGSEDKTVIIWDPSTGKLIRSFRGHSYQVHFVAFSPDGKTLASASSAMTIKIWDAATGKLIHTLKNPNASFGDVAFSPDGKTLASGSGDNTIKIWDAATGKLIRTLKGHTSSVESVAFSPDSKTLASGSWDKTVIIWDPSTGKLIRSFQGHSASVCSIAFSPDGNTLVSGSNDNAIKIWDASEGKLIRTLKGHSSAVHSVAFSPDGSTLVSGSNDDTIKIWDASTGKFIRVLKSHSHTFDFMVFSPDGKTLVSGSDDDTIKIWDAATGELIRALKGHSLFALSVAFSPDGKTLASGSQKNTTKIWNLITGKLIHTLKGHCDYDVCLVNSLAFSPDGKTLASGSRRTIEIWDAATGKLIRTLKGHTRLVTSLAFSPDSKTLASGSWDNTVKIWDAATGMLIRPLKGHTDSVTSLAFSQDGSALASGSRDTTVRVWDAATGKLIHTLKRHSNIVNSVVFSPDGNTLASGSRDNTIKIWNLIAGKLIRTLKGHSSSVDSLALSPGGNTLVSGSRDTSICFWNMSNGRLLITSYAIDKNDYITYSPQGYFSASKGAEKYAAWRINNEVYTFDQYEKQLNRPDFIARALAGEKLPPPQFNIALETPPKLFWLNPVATTDTQQMQIVLRYEATNNLHSIFCVHNNKSIDVKINTTQKTGDIHIPIKLSEYDNALIVEVSDAQRLKSSLPINFHYKKGRKGPGVSKPEPVPKEKELGEYGKKYAIVIGVSDYKHLKKEPSEKNDLVDLEYAHNDANAFINFLKDSRLSGGNWDIHEFINEKATTEAIDKALTKVLTLANHRDLIFIFFSGHARSHPLRPGDVYLLTHDFDPENPRSGYDYSLLINMVTDTKAEHVIAFVDACRSGTIPISGKGKKKPRVDAEAFSKKIEHSKENRVIFSSASGGQISYEDKRKTYDVEGHGVFTYFLLQGLEGKAPDEKFPDYVDLGELYKYVRKNVYDYVEKKFGDSQMPFLGEKRGAPDENFPVAIRLR